jgi:hypothetical protein
MRACIGNLIVSLLFVGCAASTPDTQITDPQGLAEIRVDAAPLLAASITHVIVEAAGSSQELVLNPATGSFDGSLILPAGTQSLVASAYAEAVLVGRSQAASVSVAAGVVTRVMLRILDLTTNAPPLYGPIFDALSYPTTTQAGATAALNISVVAPASDPVTYQWSSDCPGSTFSAPQAASTTWSKAAQGTCTIHVAAASHGFTITQSFVIVVFPTGSASGAVSVNGVFVTTPALALSLAGVNCSVLAGGNASCPGAIASPEVTAYQASVFNWGSSPPGTLELSDSCGGRFGTLARNPGDVTGFWLPPVGGGVCILTARAVNGDGLVGTLSAAVLVRAGAAPAMTQPPQMFVQLDSGCVFQGSATPANCGQIQAGRQLSMFGGVSWVDGLPGSVTIDDDCVGPQPEPGRADFFMTAWALLPTPGRTCTTTVRATNLQGVSSAVAARYQLVAP